MTGELFLSRFTPSMMSPDVLEKVFVQRGDLATRIVELVEESVRTPAKHHTLIIGPRGSGKTHLLALAHNRLDAKEDLRDRIRIAWLREEEWGVASFLDFLFRILRALAASYEDEALRRETELLFDMPLKSAERRAGELLREFIDGRVLLVITENVDALFQGLGKKGQQRLRAYLQEEQSWTILGSAQALFAGVTLHASPFYGFFDIHHLQELTVDDAARLVRNIAELSGDADLAAYVQSDEGRARIRAVHHLAGGNHRVYIILSEFLTRESLDQLVGPFMRMMDDLTPYYQAKMEQLSPQQRKIIDLLCSVRGAVPVKEIAKRCFITPQTASSQLKDLRERGFVESTPVGRDAYYEIAEPLMRLALEVKHQRNETIGLFLEFLRHWYAPPELARLLETTSTDAVIERHYLEAALRNARSVASDPLVGRLLTQFYERTVSNDWAAAHAAAEQLVQERGDAADWVRLGACLVGLLRPDDSIPVLERAVLMDSGSVFGWICMAAAHIARGDHESAVFAAERGIAADPSHPQPHVLAAMALQLGSRLEDALRAWDRAIAADPSFGLGWQNRGEVLFKLHRYSEALESVDEAIKRSVDSPKAKLLRGEILNGLHRFGEAIEHFTEVLDEDPEAILALRGRTLALVGIGEAERALHDAKRACLLAPNNMSDFMGFATLLIQAGRAIEVLPLVDRALKDGGPPALLLGLRLCALLRLERFDDALPELGQWLAEKGTAATHQYFTKLIVQELHGSRLFQRVGEIVALFDQHSMVPVLAAAIVKSAKDFATKGGSLEHGRTWVKEWKVAAENQPPLAVSIQLLSAVVEYRESGDQRVLLRLPLEVRQIAGELFDASGPAESPAGD